MKKYGFTLAEILIVLSIIGVVSAITLPSLSGNTSKKAKETKAQAVATDLEIAFKAAMLDADTNNVAESDLNGLTTSVLQKYMDVTDDGNGNIVTRSGACVSIDGNTLTINVKCSGNAKHSVTYTRRSNGTLTKN